MSATAKNMANTSSGIKAAQNNILIKMLIESPIRENMYSASRRLSGSKVTHSKHPIMTSSNIDQRMTSSSRPFCIACDSVLGLAVFMYRLIAL